MGRGSATYGDHAATPPAGMYRWQVKFLFEAGGERAIVDGAANLEQKIGSTSRRAEERICYALFIRRFTRKLAVSSGIAVPQPPVQPFDLRDDHCFCRRPFRIID